jgi:peroxiredoxin
MTALISLFSTILTLLLPGPTPEEVLLKARERCEQITSIKYEVVERSKTMMEKDTVLNRFEGVFMVNPKDTLVNAYFRVEMQYGKGSEKVASYDGLHWVDCNVKTKSATYFSTAQWAELIALNTDHHHLFPPYTQVKHHPMPSRKTLDEKTFEVTWLDSKDPNFYRIRVFLQSTPDSTEMITTLDVTWDWEIRKSDFLPMAYIETYRCLMGQDTLIQYKYKQVTKLELNPVIEPGLFSIERIPSDFTISEYTPTQEADGLQPGDLAPDWTLPTLDGKTLSLQDLRGKVVLIDFFYKSCYPCLLAMPELQKLHEKYKDQGVVVVGVNVFDTNENNELGLFLQKRGVSYPVVLEGKPVAKAYKAPGYPTLVCIGKDGKVIHSQTGYADGMDVTYENWIKEGLGSK